MLDEIFTINDVIRISKAALRHLPREIGNPRETCS
jgi:hypothetical protein